MTTVADLVRARAEDDGEGLRFEGRRWTWRQVVAESERRGAFLAAWPWRGPPHAGVLLENVPEFLFVLLGAALAGVVVVGVNPTRRGAELARDVRHTDCGLLLTDADGLGLLDGLDLGPAAGRVLAVDDPGYRRRLADAPARTDRRPRPDDLYLLLFTSGSTGAPKAVRVSQGRMAAGALAMATGSGFGPDDVLYSAMPLFHGNALTTCVVPALASGATLVLRRRFSASGFAEDVRREGATYFNYVGRALAYILATPPAPTDADNRLRFAFGTEASPADIRAFRRRFGCPVVEGYGSSEGGMSMSRVPGTPPTALGQPPPGTDVVVVDPETGRECPRARFDADGRLLNAEEAVGELVARDGVARFEGYYANAEAEAERTRQGWFWSGDLGYRDEAGFFYFAGRPADWLRVDGENFAAAPVERILARWPAVFGVAVYGVPDSRTGDQVMACLELTADTAFDPAAFAAFLAAQPDLGTKWAPRFVRLGRVPLTATGKVDKQPLRRERWRTGDPLYWRPGAALEYRPFTAADAAAWEADFHVQGRARALET